LKIEKKNEDTATTNQPNVGIRFLYSVLDNNKKKDNSSNIIKKIVGDGSIERYQI
jgi:hypothetical protein